MIGRVIFGAIDLGCAVLQAAVRTHERARKLWRWALRRPEPLPLTRRPARRTGR